MILTIGFMALKKGKSFGAIPAPEEIIWRKLALIPHAGTCYPRLKKR